MLLVRLSQNHKQIANVCRLIFQDGETTNAIRILRECFPNCPRLDSVAFAANDPYTAYLFGHIALDEMQGHREI